MYYTDGSVYEGEWYDDHRSGQGMLRLGKNNKYNYKWYHLGKKLSKLTMRHYNVCFFAVHTHVKYMDCVKKD